MWVFSSPTIGLKPLSVVCRSLGTMIESGVSVLKACELATDKISDRRAQDALANVSRELRLGSDVESAMRAQGDRFPELMIDMIAVAEQTGALPEVLLSLAEHYENNLRLRKEFLTAITWPVVQLAAAIGIIGLLILVLGWIGESRGQTVDVLGWGLTGTTGAITWFVGVGLVALGLFVAFRMAARSLKSRKMIDPLLLRVPVLGHCMRSFAIARFSWAFALTQQSGMNLRPSIESSLRATGNGAFLDATRPIWNRLKAGDPLSIALADTRLFPRDYLHIVEVSETSGTVPEALARLSGQFEDQARRSLNTLVATLSWGVWGIVAVFIIFVIFSIALWYVGMLNEATQQAM